MAKAQLAKEEIKINLLWLDDEPESVENYKKLLAHSGKIDVVIVKTIEEAQRELDTGNYHGFVADFNLSVGENGARFLFEYSKQKKFFPTFVSSAWTTDPKYLRDLKKSYPLAIDNKASEFRNPLLETEFFKTIYASGKKFNEVKDFTPERITFLDYFNNPLEYKKPVGLHWKKHNHWVCEELKREKNLWGVVCGLDIVEKGKNLEDFPDEEQLMKMGQEQNLIPFAYTLPIIPETTSVWSLTTLPNDFYPTLRLKIGDDHLIDDFDTGAYQSIFSEDLIKKSIFNFFQEVDNVHLGEEYKYFSKKIHIEIEDLDGRVVKKDVTVQVVKNWSTTSFTRYNRKRKALFGRDILRAVEMEVLINSKKRVTQIHFL